jgi:hypothetical protein
MMPGEGYLDVRRCRICGCSESDACEGGCRWTEADLCDTCRMLIDELIGSLTPYFEVAGARYTRLIRQRLFLDPDMVPTVAASLITQRLLPAVREAVSEIVRASRADLSPSQPVQAAPPAHE